MSTTLKQLAALSAIALCIGMASAGAQVFRPGEGQTVDEVTGLLCVTPGCDFVRYETSEARCICQKLNPTERQLSQLQLQCTTRESGQWVQCPIRPPYGR